jgi:hypothetical protein
MGFPGISGIPEITQRSQVTLEIAMPNRALDAACTSKSEFYGRYLPIGCTMPTSSFIPCPIEEISMSIKCRMTVPNPGRTRI